MLHCKGCRQVPSGGRGAEHGVQINNVRAEAPTQLTTSAAALQHAQRIVQEPFAEHSRGHGSCRKRAHPAENGTRRVQINNLRAETAALHGQVADKRRTLANMATRITALREQERLLIAERGSGNRYAPCSSRGHHR